MLLRGKIKSDKIGRKVKLKMSRENNSTKARRSRFLKSSYLIYVNLFYYITNTQLGWYSGVKINKRITHCFFFIIKKKKSFVPILQFFHFLKKWKNLKEKLKLKQVISNIKKKKKFPNIKHKKT